MGDKMKSMNPHISVGQKIFDPFISQERSKTKEHTDRLRSDYTGNIIFENSQKLTKNEEIES